MTPSDTDRLPPLTVALTLVRKTAFLVFVLALVTPWWPVYLLLRLGMARPPNLPSPGRIWHCLRLITRERPESPGVSAAARLALVLTLSTRCAATPLWGVCWFLDEILYGRALRRVSIVAPLFEISAARSGSTQIGHYIEDDPRICAPSVLQELFPYVWMWKLAPRTVGRVLSKEEVRERFLASQPPEFIQRHEMEPFKTDTFEIPFLMAMQLGDLMFPLSARVMREELNSGLVATPDRGVWEDDFLRFIDALGRKVLMTSARSGEPGRRLMIKGHFLLVAPQLAQRYPDARFLTVLRAPDKRIQSLINFWRHMPFEPICGPAPWPWLAEAAVSVEIAYCDVEMDWYQRTDGVRRCVIPFTDFLSDLEGTMHRVYRECLDVEELPPHVPRAHAPRDRSNYSVDRSLPELGVDVAALNLRLAAYRRWCGT